MPWQREKNNADLPKHDLQCRITEKNNLQQIRNNLAAVSAGVVQTTMAPGLERDVFEDRVCVLGGSIRGLLPGAALSAFVGGVMTETHNNFGNLGQKLYRNGYAVLPLTGKAPLIPNWPTLTISDFQVRSWVGIHPRLNIGLRCDQALMIDIDTPNFDEAEHIETSLLQRHPGGLVRRRGPGSKRALLFRRADPAGEYCQEGCKQYLHPQHGLIELYDSPRVQMGIFSHQMEGGDYWWVERTPIEVQFDDLTPLTPEDWSDVRSLLLHYGYSPTGGRAAQPQPTSADRFEDLDAHGLFSIEAQIEHIMFLQVAGTGWENAVTRLAGALANRTFLDKQELAQIAERITWPGYQVSETCADLLTKVSRFMVQDWQRAHRAKVCPEGGENDD